MTMGAQYTAKFSHEFDEGPSGPRRSYWDVLSPSGAVVVTLCLHHRDDRCDVQSTAEHVCIALMGAFGAGELHKAQQVRFVLGVK
jgi:hypothetical protein